MPRKSISLGWRCAGSRKLVSANGTGAKAEAAGRSPFARRAEALSLLGRKLSAGAAGALERGSEAIAGTARGHPRPRCVAPADSPDVSCGRSRAAKLAAGGSARSSARATRRWKSYWRAVVLKPAPRRAAAPPRTLWDRWEKKLAQLAGFTFPVSEGPSGSAAKPASPAARKNSPHPGRPRRLSGAR